LSKDHTAGGEFFMAGKFNATPLMLAAAIMGQIFHGGNLM